MLLNIDLGELPDEPEALYGLAQMANVACGGHAGDEASVARALTLALAHGITVAAHPSYPDRARFGRVSVPTAPAELRGQVASQCSLLARVARQLGAVVTTVKPHGALYHDASRDPALALAVIEGAAEGLGLEPSALAVVGPPRGSMNVEAARLGARYLREGFADRGYAPDGSLLPRGTTGALLSDPDEAARQAVSLARQGSFDTLCVHGDSPGAVDVARAVRLALDRLDPPA